MKKKIFNLPFGSQIRFKKTVTKNSHTFEQGNKRTWKQDTFHFLASEPNYGITPLPLKV